MSLEFMLELARMEASSLYYLLGMLNGIVPNKVRVEANANIIDIQRWLNHDGNQVISEGRISQARVSISNTVSDVLKSIASPLSGHVLRNRKIVAAKLSSINALSNTQYAEVDQNWLQSLGAIDEYFKNLSKNNQLSQLLSKIKIDLFLHSKNVEAQSAGIIGIDNIRNLMVANVGVRWNITVPLSTLLSRLIRPAPPEIEEMIDVEDLVAAEVVLSALSKEEICLRLAKIEKNHFEELINELDTTDFFSIDNHSSLLDRFYEISEPLQEDNIFNENELNLEELIAIRSGMCGLYQDYLQALKMAVSPRLPQRIKEIEIAGSNLESAKSFILQDDLTGNLSYPRSDFCISPYTVIQGIYEKLDEAEEKCNSLMSEESSSIIRSLTSSWRLWHVRADGWISCSDGVGVENRFHRYIESLSSMMKKIKFLCQEFLGDEQSSEIARQCRLAQELFELTYPLQKRDTQKVSIEGFSQSNSIFSLPGNIGDRVTPAKRKEPVLAAREGDHDRPLKKPHL